MAKLDELRERLRRGETLIEPSRQHEVASKKGAPVSVSQLLEEMAEDDRRKIAVDLAAEASTTMTTLDKEICVSTNTWEDIMNFSLEDVSGGHQLDWRAEVGIRAIGLAQARLFNAETLEVIAKFDLVGQKHVNNFQIWSGVFRTHAKNLKLQLRLASGRGIGGTASIRKCRIQVTPLI